MIPVIRRSAITAVFSGMMLWTLPALALDTTIENLDISGMLRLRFWYTGSQVKVPDRFPAGEGYSSVNYEDILFRNRFDLKVLPNIRIKAVFDISSAFGRDDFALGSGGTNLVTRDVYAIINPSPDSEFTIGLQPFSLQGGYILARDASGIQYTHYLFERSLKLYSGLIRAFDDADARYGDNTRPPKYADDNIYLIGASFNLSSIFYSDVYYTFEHDRYTSIDDDGKFIDNRKATLHWVGIHNKLLWGNWIFRAGGIINWGYLLLDSGSGSQRTDILAMLLEFEAGYRFNGIQASIVGEGATGDPNDPEAGKSFQDIKSSHEFSYIVVDNYGGLSIRGSGESSWYGLYGAGTKIQFTLLDTITTEMRLLHFRTTRSPDAGGNSSTWFGDEFDIRGEYMYQEALSLFMTAGIFRPGRAYRSLESVLDQRSGFVIEVMLGAQVTY